MTLKTTRIEENPGERDGSRALGSRSPAAKPRSREDISGRRICFSCKRKMCIFFFNIPTINIIQSSLVVICLKIEVPGEFTIASVGKHLEKVDIIYLGSHFTFARKAYKVLGSRSPIRTWLDVVSATSLLVLVPWRSLVPLKSILSHSMTKRSIWAPGAMESTFQDKETDVSVTWYG